MTPGKESFHIASEQRGPCKSPWFVVDALNLLGIDRVEGVYQNRRVGEGEGVYHNRFVGEGKGDTSKTLKESAPKTKDSEGRNEPAGAG